MASKRLNLEPIMLLGWVLLMAYFFAMVEIQIEGSNGWAASLPTWRLEKHFLLDVFWGGRPMTGYHAWVFSFMALAFHLPHFIIGGFSWRIERRVLGCLMLFWIAEDFLWFALNPAFGVAKLTPACVPWHLNWLCGFPTDYYVFTTIGLLMLWSSYRMNGQSGDPNGKYRNETDAS